MVPEKLTPEEVRNSAAPLIVCAYEDEDKCKKYPIDGALTLAEFRARLGTIPKDELIVFY